MKGFCFLLVCLIAFSVGLYGQEELTIDDIIDMVQAVLSDSFIQKKIQISTLEYPPTVEDLVEFRMGRGFREDHPQGPVEFCITDKVCIRRYASP